MSITSPADFLKDLDMDFFQKYRQISNIDMSPIEYVEPDLTSISGSPGGQADTLSTGTTEDAPTRNLDKISSTVVTLGDFIDTDAVSGLTSCCSCC